MKVDSLHKLYLPEPPTPTNKAFPPGKDKILAILTTCSMAYSNKTKFI